jgi:hypothetical protein
MCTANHVTPARIVLGGDLDLLVTHRRESYPVSGTSVSAFSGTPARKSSSCIPSSPRAPASPRSGLKAALRLSLFLKSALFRFSVRQMPKLQKTFLGIRHRLRRCSGDKRAHRAVLVGGWNCCRKQHYGAAVVFRAQRHGSPARERRVANVSGCSKSSDLLHDVDCLLIVDLGVYFRSSN